ncbi:peptidase inhibitor family I36 protein, partial [Actinoallomurus sp. NPDC050550]|uniref:peptidase inhibitor family I36 protein n=1 Tax=Actinoallomurus sp. NPDC050550 TaxID=3154937 RepID=UPI003410790E
KCVKNSAASVWNRSSKTVRVYFNSNYGGRYQPPVRRYRHSSDTGWKGVRADLLPCGRVPHLHGSVTASSGDDKAAVPEPH